MKKHKIILADDHEFLIAGIISILRKEETLQVIATANNGFDLFEKMKNEKPDLVILDLNMPRIDGLQCLQKIKIAYPSVKVMILSNYSHPALIEEVRLKKSDGFLAKNCSSDTLIEAIKSILAGSPYFDSTKSKKLPPDDTRFFDDYLKKFQLTKREVLIIRMICNELSSKEIASRLFLSVMTVNTHRRNIFRKLQLKNVAGLIQFAKNNLANE